MAGHLIATGATDDIARILQNLAPISKLPEPTICRNERAERRWLHLSVGNVELVAGSLSRYGKLGDQDGVDLPCPGVR